MKLHQSQSGYSLVEVLVSISVLLIAIVGPMTIAAQGIKSATFSLEQNTAFFLAQEGIEAMFVIRNNYGLGDVQDGIQSFNPDTSWNWIADVLNGTGPCSITSNGDSCSFGIDFDDSTIENNITTSSCSAGNEANCLLYIDEAGIRGVFTHDSTGTASQFTRIITVTRADTYAVVVTSLVTWESKVFGGATQSVTLTSFIFDPV